MSLWQNCSRCTKKCREVQLWRSCHLVDRRRAEKKSTRLRQRHCVFGNWDGVVSKNDEDVDESILSVIEVLNLLHGKKLWDIPKIKSVLVLRIHLKVISATPGSLTPIEKVWGRAPWHSPTGKLERPRKRNSSSTCKVGNIEYDLCLSWNSQTMTNWWLRLWAMQITKWESCYAACLGNLQPNLKLDHPQ